MCIVLIGKRNACCQPSLCTCVYVCKVCIIVAVVAKPQMCIILMVITCAGKVEEALVSHSTDTILFELVKFLLQSIFLIMDEEHETLVQLDSQERLATVAATVSLDAEAAAEDGGRSATGSNSIGT